MITLWAGGARATECSFLEFAISLHGQRAFHILNGMVTIVTTYVKTQSHHGDSRLIARAVPWQLARYMVLLYAVVYPAASHLATYVYGKDEAEAYASFMFVQSGKVMDGTALSKAIHSFSSKAFDIAMGVRLHRQTMCSILSNITQIDFGQIDPEDTDLMEIHYMFGHSPKTGTSHYALQSTDSMRTISHTTISLMQHTSLMYHSTIGLSHPNAAKIEDDDLETRGQVDTPRLISSVNTALEANVKLVATELKEHIATEFTAFAQGFGSAIMQRMTHLHAPSIQTLLPSSPILVSPHLLKMITPLLPYGRPPAFTLPQQAEAIQSSMTNSHALIVMPTGGGKSLSFMAVPLLLRSHRIQRIVIVITPLIPLTEDMSRRLAATDIRAAKWTGNQNPFDLELLLVSAHQAGTREFFSWAVTNAHWIHRIFIDEAHHIYLSITYRDCFRLFYKLTEVGKPITFLSATIFPHSVPYLCEIMKMDPSLLLHIRAPITRPNLKIHATQFDDFDGLIEAVQTLVRSIELGAEDRGLVFCTTTANCRMVAQMLGVDYYVAQIKPNDEENSREKTRLDEQWRNGALPSHRWMVATLCFGQGIDFAGIRHVIHIELRNLIDYLQEMGRAGRDGQPANVHAFYTHLPPIADAQMPHDHAGVLALRDFLETASCRRLSLRSIDWHTHSCGALIGGQLCDNCDRMSEVMFYHLST
jgi:Helicase conserved C-terminal domain/DEAD/DEAH box helicase